MPGVDPGFKDHFSTQSAGYAKARPVYPEALFRHLARLPATDTPGGAVWDCGTGNGQAAAALSGHFKTVVATDASIAQVSKAPRAVDLHSGGRPHILYAAASAERAPLRAASVDLVTVAQALHWFDFRAFFAEAARVARPGAAFAAWCYGNCRVTPEVDLVYDALYGDIVGPYWPPERAHIEDGYRSIPIPFPPLACPAFAMESRWNLADFLAYLETWSAVQRYRKERGKDPVALVRGAMEAAWGNPREARPVHWPLSVRAGRIGA